MNRELRLAQECEYDSSGTFRIDLAQARGRYRLDLLNFNDVLLYLTQAAVAGGATRVRVQGEHSSLSFEFSCPLPEPREFSRLLDWCTSSSNPVQHRMSLAALACLTPQGQGCSLDFPDGTRVRLQSERLSLGRHNETLGGVRWRIPIRRSWLSWGRPHACLKALVQRARFAPLEVLLDDRRLNSTFGCPLTASSWSVFSDKSIEGPQDQIYASAHHLLETRRPAPDPGLSLNLPWPSQASHCLRFESNQGFRCGSAFARKVRGRAELTVVQYGVALWGTEKPALETNTWLVLADHTLETDPGCLRLVESAALKRTVEEQRKEWEDLVQPLQERHRSNCPEVPFEFWLAETRPELPTSQRAYRG